MDIEGLSTAAVEKFLDLKLVNNISDIYDLHLKKDLLINIDGFGKKSIEKLLTAIEKSKQNNIDRLIFGLGIEHIGKKASSLIADNFSNMDEIISADINDFTSIDTFGEIMAKSIVGYFKNDDAIELMNKLKKQGVNMKSQSFSNNKKISEKLSDKTFVITGSFNGYTRDELKLIISKNGGNVTDSISKKTDYLLVGENPGSKLSKAEILGIRIINIEELMSILLY
jgi:DNA ligase (NAD+)